ncbi:hypothetical protein [Persicobacter diffluens]|uniref:Uncharacterized protein n=1 Tax=Persicobacter diffluens TaxID=981 RepID=A0AAN4W0T4_9BACT|nr:hypothetical protein PEDI_29520 [Persicobacter diffluens]
MKPNRYLLGLLSFLMFLFSCSKTVITQSESPVKESLVEPQLVVVYDGEQDLDWVCSFEERLASSLPSDLNAVSIRKVLFDPHATVEQHVKSLMEQGKNTVLLVKLVKDSSEMNLTTDADGGSIRGRQQLDQQTPAEIEDAVVLRAELYDLKSRKLVYNCLSKTGTKKPSLGVGSSFGKALGKNMRKEGLWR